MQSEEQAMKQRVGYVMPKGIHSAPGTGETIAKVVGGMLGGTVGLVLLVLLIFLIITRVKTGHWVLNSGKYTNGYFIFRHCQKIFL